MDNLHDGESDRRVTLATAPVNWNNFDLPDWRTAARFPDILDLMTAAGYAYTEWDASFGTEPDELLRESRARDIAFCGAYRWFDFQDGDQFAQDLDAFMPLAGLLQAIGVTNLIIADRLRPQRVALAGRAYLHPESALNDHGFRAIARHVSTLAEAVAPYDLRVHYHNHVGTAIESPAEVQSLLLHLDPAIGVCFDTGHYAYGGGDPQAFLEEHGARCRYLHLKDVDPAVLGEARREEWSFLDALRHIVFPPIGEGNVPFDAIAATLVNNGFTGTIVIEQDTCLGDPTEVAAQNRERIARAFGSGFGI